MLFFLSLPIIIEADVILSVWLSEVPAHTSSFLRITLFTTIVSAMAGPFTVSAQANGKIKKYQAIVGGVMLLTLPLSYLGLKLIEVPELVYIIDLGIIIIAQVIRAIFMKQMIGLLLREYIMKVIAPVLSVTILSSIAPVIAYFNMQNESLASFMVVSSLSVVSVAFAVYFVGINDNEREKFISFVRNKI